MNKSKNFKAVVTLFIVFIMCAVPISVFSIHHVNANVELSNAQILDEYIVDDEISLKDARLSAGGQSYEFESLLLRPDGVNEYGEEFDLKQTGEYSITLRAVNCAENYIYKKKFKVNEMLCSFSGSTSTGELTSNGVMVRLTDGDELAINQIIDLSNATKDSEILNISIVPTMQGVVDFTKINIKFTDISDPNSYIKVLLQNTTVGASGSYALAGATNQAMTGYEPEWDRIHRNNEWGSYFPLSFCGTDGTSNSFDIRYDSQTQEIFSKPGYRIIDFDNSDFFLNTWKGLTSGKVKISIKASGYNKNQAQFLINSIGGEKINDLVLREGGSPKIEVQCDENNLPIAVVGTPYKIFQATATDSIYGACAVDSKVYLNYGQLNSVNVECANGYFTPKNSDVYSLVYTSVNKFGNMAKKCVEVRAVESLPDLRISVDKDNVTYRGMLGEYAVIGGYLLSGGSGASVVTASVMYGSKLIDLYENRFIPEYAGEYTVSFVAKDYIGNTATCEYVFTAYPRENPVIKGSAKLPKYFIKGKDYAIPIFSGIDYSNGSPNDIVFDTYIKAGDKIVKIQNGESCKMDFNSDKVSVIYRYKDFEDETVIPLIQVENSSGIDMARYFNVDSGMSGEATDSGILFQSNKNAGFEFVREVLAQDFSIKFNINSSMNNFSEVVITLSDMYDSNQIVTFSYVRKDNSAVFKINDKYVTDILQSGFTEASGNNDFNLTILENVISPSDSFNVTLSEYLNGDAFTGFSSNRVYVSMDMIGVYGNSSLYVRNINGQPFNTATTDRIKPQIVILGDYGGEYAIHDTVIIPAADASDVLDPNIVFSFSVFKPDGISYVTATDGTVLKDLNPNREYSFKIDEYGIYMARYSARDSGGSQPRQLSYSIQCEEKISPEITFQHTDFSGVKVGDIVAIPSVTITDNISSSQNVKHYIYITTPRGETVRLEDGKNAFKAEYAGVYKIVCIAYDEAFNMGMAILEIKVGK